MPKFQVTILFSIFSKLFIIWIYCLIISRKVLRTHLLGNNEAQNNLVLLVVFTSVFNLYFDFSSLSESLVNGVSKALAMMFLLLLSLVCRKHFLPEILFALKNIYEITSHCFSLGSARSPPLSTGPAGGLPYPWSCFLLTSEASFSPGSFSASFPSWKPLLWHTYRSLSLLKPDCWHRFLSCLGPAAI